MQCTSPETESLVNLSFDGSIQLQVKLFCLVGTEIVAQ